MLLLSRDFSKPKLTTDSINLLSFTRFEKNMRDTGTLYVFIGKEICEGVEVLEAVVSLIKEFGDIFLDELQKVCHRYEIFNTR